MDFPIKELPEGEWPPMLREIPQPPRQLNYRGALPPADIKLLSVVGSRKYTSYGRQAVEHLLAGLRGYPVGIVSGLALGIDSLAHQAALDNGLYTLAIPGGGLADSSIYPRNHKPLAHKILAAGGGMLSEYEPGFHAAPWSFPERNRLVAGIAHATLVVEAGEKSGSLITARLAADYSRELLVVPGSIFSANSKGTHQFLKLGAAAAAEPADILDALGLAARPPGLPAFSAALSAEERAIINLLAEPTGRDRLIRESGLSAAAAGIVLMRMEMNGLIAEQDGIYRKNIA